MLQTCQINMDQSNKKWDFFILAEIELTQR
jgi:hypothetical protein